MSLIPSIIKWLSSDSNAYQSWAGGFLSLHCTPPEMGRKVVWANA